MPAVQEYVVIETNATPKVLVYRRTQNTLWMIYILTLDDEIELTSIGLSFPVVDIYHNTRFSRRKREQERLLEGTSAENSLLVLRESSLVQAYDAPGCNI